MDKFSRKTIYHMTQKLELRTKMDKFSSTMV